MSSDKPLVYLILGASGSGRREVVADLIEGGLSENDRAAVLLAEGEATDPADARLGSIERWRLTPDHAIDAALPEGATRVFFLADGRHNPPDQAEALKAWLEANGAELGSILCIVNCQLAEKNPPLLAWYEACIHFADMVFLNRREGVANKWITGFLAHFHDKFYPCLFELVKAGRVKNPALVLEPQARRMSHIFDEEQNWVFTDADGNEIDEQEETDDEEGVEAAPEEDPYLARDAAGRRAKRIPDIAKYLQPSPEAPR
jgi:hypothetical protein